MEFNAIQKDKITIIDDIKTLGQSSHQTVRCKEIL
jgi:orotate phosphoribosyltransferase